MLDKYRGVRLRWIMSFLIVITLIMLLSVSFFVLIRAQVTQEAVTSNYSSSTFIKNIIDERLNNIQNLSYQIVFNDLSLQLLDAGSSDSFKTQRTYQLVNNIRNFILSNNFIDDIYLYYPKYDYIVGKQGIYKSKAYYLLQNKHRFEGYELWINSVKTSSNMKYFQLKNGTNSDLLFSRLARSGKDSSSSSILIIKISKQSVDNILKWSNAQDLDQFVAITDDKNQILASNGDKGLVNVINAAAKKEVKEISDNYYSYKDYYIVYQPSKLKGLNYYLIKNRGYVLKIQTMITNILIISIFTCMLAGILLSIYLSSINVKPLISILQRIKTIPEGKGINEYDLISQKIDAIFLENETAILQIEQQQKIIYSSFVRALLSNECRDEAAIDSLSAIYGINFENPYFCVVTAQFNFKKDNAADKQDISSINKLLDSCMNRDFALYYSNFGVYDVIIINYDCEEEAKERVVDGFVTSISDYCAKEGISLSCATGGIYENPDKINNSYQEALLKINAGRASLTDIGSIKQSKSDKNNNTDSSAFKIKSFIDNNYSNPILGLGCISEELGITTSYISRVFKEKYRIGAVEYINTVRIEHAKELIKQDDMNIKEIALKVGFSSDVSFIRVFKKYENVTPGKYNVIEQTIIDIR